jgi:hypothetical protein
VYRNVPQLIGFGLQALTLGFVIGMCFYQLPEVGPQCIDRTILLMSMTDSDRDTEFEVIEFPAYTGCILSTTSFL